MEKIKKAIEKFIEGDNHIFLSEEIGYKNDFNSKDVFLCKPEIFIIIKQEHNGLEVNKTLGRKLNKMSCKALKHKKKVLPMLRSPRLQYYSHPLLVMFRKMEHGRR